MLPNTDNLTKTMKEVTHLVYSLEKMIAMYMQEQEKEQQNLHIFMCEIANKLESRYLQDLMRDFLKKDRPTFNYWVTENYTKDIINPPMYSVFLCARQGYDVKKLNEIRFLYLHHLLTNFRNLLDLWKPQQ
jgi:hypothetical protein